MAARKAAKEAAAGAQKAADDEATRKAAEEAAQKAAEEKAARKAAEEAAQKAAEEKAARKAAEEAATAQKAAAAQKAAEEEAVWKAVAAGFVELHVRFRFFVLRRSPIRCQSVANPVGVARQSAANPVRVARQSATNPLPIRLESLTNPLPIGCQSDFECLTNPQAIRYQSAKLTVLETERNLATSWTFHVLQPTVNLKLFCCVLGFQFWNRNSRTIEKNRANPLQFANQPPIRSGVAGQSAPIRCQSVANPQRSGAEWRHEPVGIPPIRNQETLKTLLALAPIRSGVAAWTCNSANPVAARKVAEEAAAAAQKAATAQKAAEEEAVWKVVAARKAAEEAAAAAEEAECFSR